MIALPPANKRSWPWFLAWFVLGAGYALTLLGALTIGVFILPFVLAGTIAVVRRSGSRAGAAGLISGLALPLIYVAYLNRDGPGTVCTIYAGGQSCTEEMNPWPWLALAAVLVIIGLLAFRMTRRRRRAAGARGSSAPPTPRR
jgi:cytochrome bd-type quinol oxidase subunit 2